jgi:hypothetical protein
MFGVDMHGHALSGGERFCAIAAPRKCARKRFLSVFRLSMCSEKSRRLKRC